MPFLKMLYESITRFPTFLRVAPSNMTFRGSRRTGGGGGGGEETGITSFLSVLLYCCMIAQDDNALWRCRFSVAFPGGSCARTSALGAMEACLDGRSACRTYVKKAGAVVVPLVVLHAQMRSHSCPAVTSSDVNHDPTSTAVPPPSGENPIGKARVSVVTGLPTKISGCGLGSE